MRHSLGFLLIVAVLFATPFASSAADGEFRYARYSHLLGLWEGVDVNDGSKRTISITDRDDDGVFEVASRDTYWTLCQGDRGIEVASGEVRRDGVLATDGLVMCFETGDEIPVHQTYEYSRDEDTLFATPDGTNLIPITLHRVSD